MVGREPCEVRAASMKPAGILLRCSRKAARQTIEGGVHACRLPATQNVKNSKQVAWPDAMHMRPELRASLRVAASGRHTAGTLGDSRRSYQPETLFWPAGVGVIGVSLKSRAGKVPKGRFSPPRTHQVELDSLSTDGQHSWVQARDQSIRRPPPAHLDFTG